MILGIETSTPHASLALVASPEEEAVFRSDFVSQRAHNAVIFEPVTELLANHRDEITGIAMGVGPGSYGGVRVGIAVANGLSLVLGVPVCGVSSLESWNTPSESYEILGDARRKTFFRARVEARSLVAEPSLFPEEEAMAQVQAALASGATHFFTADERVSEKIPGVVLSFPDAEGVARRALATPVEAWEETTLEPHYLRAPFITKPKAK